jgi:hypothetical protein
MVALIQRVAIIQVADTGVGTIYLIGLQIIFGGIIIHLRTGQKVYDNIKLRYIALISYLIIYVGLYYLTMYPFFRAESLDMVLVTLSVVAIANYELLFFKGYEEYEINWKKRLLIVLPVALILLFVVNPIITGAFRSNPRYFYDYVNFQDAYVIARRDITGNFISAVTNVIIYIIYKLDAELVITPKVPTTTDFWIKFDPEKNYME